MPVIGHRKSKAGKIVAGIILFIILLPALWACADRQEEGQDSSAAVKAETFTFFDLGINTRLTKKVRKELGNKLGSDAIERRSIMDLEINYKGFLAQYFPDLNALNQKLNFPAGERVDHSTVKLMYRYARKKNVPFDYVELVFSNFTNTPLLFKINFTEDEAGIVQTLQSKYGPPQTVDWEEENGQSLYWMKMADYLIVSRRPDQFGILEHQIVIYFVKNLEQLIAAEKNEQKEKILERTQSGKKAF